MITIAPGLRAGMVQAKQGGAVHLAIAVECDGFVNTVNLDETQVHTLFETLKNTMDAMAAVRLNRPIPRRRNRFA